MHEYLGLKIHSENNGGWHSHWLEVQCRRCGNMGSLDMPMPNGDAVREAFLAGAVLPLEKGPDTTECRPASVAGAI